MSRIFSIRSDVKRKAATGLVAAFLLCGCATIPEQVADISDIGTVAELDSTPFFPQKRYQCGPAALTTLLFDSGIDVSLETITGLTYIPGRQGSLQAELLSAARSYDRIPYQLDGNLAAIAAELKAGRPVLVLQNLGVRWYPRWHYAVVVGIDTETEKVILRSGTDRRRLTGIGTLLRTWQRGDYWGVVLLKPGELPANPDKQRFLRSVADVEASGRHRAAYSSWSAALEEWPGEPYALFGKANSAFQLGEFADAEQSYRQLLAQDPDFYAARNNLAYVLAEQGLIAAALDELRSLLDDIDEDDPLRAEYESSLRELLEQRDSTR